LGPEVARKVDDSIRSSLLHAMQQPDQIMGYVLSRAQEMDLDVVSRHIELYVNPFSLDLGAEGELAVETLFSKAERAGLIPASSLPIMAY
jgi:1,4-dihydroxy-6-naphthoate synthase